MDSPVTSPSVLQPMLLVEPTGQLAPETVVSSKVSLCLSTLKAVEVPSPKGEELSLTWNLAVVVGTEAFTGRLQVKDFLSWLNDSLGLDGAKGSAGGGHTRHPS